MKNRFYGDVNDYIKYGVLDILSGIYKSIGINWYLTDDEHGKKGDGKIDRHITKEKDWKDYNSTIYCKLKKRRLLGQRDIKYCKKDKVFDFKHEYTEKLPDNAKLSDYEVRRKKWHDRAKSRLAKCDLVFFDPDIGVIDQLSKDVVKNSEYCLAKEIADYHWCDWFIVIFPKHAKRYPTLKSNPIVKEAQKLKRKMAVFLYGGMALIYVSDSIKLEILHQVFKAWDTKVKTMILIP